jgi:hypothetical protein
MFTAHRFLGAANPPNNQHMITRSHSEQSNAPFPHNSTRLPTHVSSPAFAVSAPASPVASPDSSPRGGDDDDDDNNDDDDERAEDDGTCKEGINHDDDGTKGKEDRLESSAGGVGEEAGITRRADRLDSYELTRSRESFDFNASEPYQSGRERADSVMMPEGSSRPTARSAPASINISPPITVPPSRPPESTAEAPGSVSPPKKMRSKLQILLPSEVIIHHDSSQSSTPPPSYTGHRHSIATTSSSSTPPPPASILKNASANIPPPNGVRVPTLNLDPLQVEKDSTPASSDPNPNPEAAKSSSMKGSNSASMGNSNSGSVKSRFHRYPPFLL